MIFIFQSHKSSKSHKCHKFTRVTTVTSVTSVAYVTLTISPHLLPDDGCPGCQCPGPAHQPVLAVDVLPDGRLEAPQLLPQSGQQPCNTGRQAGLRSCSQSTQSTALSLCQCEHLVWPGLPVSPVLEWGGRGESPY